MRFTVSLESISDPFFREALRKQREYEASRDNWRLDHPLITKDQIQNEEKNRSKTS